MKYRVLLIDDEPSALEGMLLWVDWQELGFEVCGTSSNGKEGLELIKRLAPDLVITDINMPLMNGLEMIAACQQEGNKETKFAILSGYSEFEYAKTAMHYGINHYLLKPVFPEEAAEELKEIYQELEQETRKRNLNQIASSEEITAMIKGVLHGKPADELELPALTRLSEGNSHWNVCLVQTEPALFAELIEKIASILSDKGSMFLIHLEADCCGIVYGYGSEAGINEETAIYNLLKPLRHEFPEPVVYMAVGASETSLFHIANSYRTAKEALIHSFYCLECSGVLSYQSIQDNPFSYQYDHIQLMDALIKPINILDTTGFYQAVHSASCSFREKRVAPEVVKKIVIHIMYQLLEFTSATSKAQMSSSLSEIRMPEMQDSMITLTDLMNNLLFCGQTIIDILLKEQNQRSQGIVQEINNYIEAHYHECLTIKKLSEVFFLHPVYLGQLLIKKNGINFNEQLHNLRINEATLLLRQNKLKSSEIAEKVGYSNYGQFLKQFEKKLQMSPKDYKQLNT